tara:strand:+ start:394 stop:627 length:234 start_codon:yes stop_codon:yes gene_type:complete
MNKEEIKREFVFEAEIILRQHNAEGGISQNSVEKFQEELTGVLQRILLKNDVDYDNMSDLIAFIQPTILDYLDKLTE